MKANWSLTVLKSDLVQAIGHARTRATLRRKGRGLEPEIVFTGDGRGTLSVRSSAAAMDVPADGSWCSPVAVDGATLRRLAPKLAGPRICLTYVTGRLFLDQTSIPAREV